MDLAFADGVVDNDTFPVLIEPFVVNPVSRERTIRFVVTTKEAGVFEVIGIWLSPTGGLWVEQKGFSPNFGVSAMGTVHGDTPPIDEFVTLPDCGDAHEIMIVGKPCVTFRNAFWSRIESHCDRLVGNVVWTHLKGVVHVVAEIHLHVGAKLSLLWSGTGISLGFNAC